MIMNKDSSKSSPSMVADYQMRLEYLIITRQIIHSLKINGSWLSNLLKLLNLLKWLTYRSDYFTFYNNMSQKRNIDDV